MSLSRPSTLTSLQVAADIAKAFSVLADPVVLEKTIKDMYALSDIEFQKSESARNDIKEYFTAIAKNEQQLADIARQKSEINDTLQKISNEWANLDKRSLVLNSQQDALNKTSDDLENIKKSLTNRESEISQRESKVSSRENAVSKREGDVESSERDLRDRIEKFQGFAKGL